jgi:alpha-tubulin suppressor-like RCC1 family protein
VNAGVTRRLVSLRIPHAMTALMLTTLAAGQPAAAIAVTSTCSVNPVDAGEAFSGAIVNGQLFQWGRNYEGQLGLGYVSASVPSPTMVSSNTGLSTATGIWSGNLTGFAVDPSGKAWGWGDNSNSQRGNAGGASSPQPILGPTNVVSIGAGLDHTIAATAGGSVWGWGQADSGQLGPLATVQTSPVLLTGLSNVTKVAAGSGFSLALTSNGTVYGTGRNNSGQLGLGSGVLAVHSFQLIPGLSGVIEISAGRSADTEFTAVVDQNGHVFEFGSNFDGQMGNGSHSSTPQFTPIQVAGIDSVVSVATGYGHVLALKRDGTIWAWGSNAFGQLGDGTRTDVPTPAPVSFPAGVSLVAVAAGLSHSMALDSTGGLWAWGHNGAGEIGTGSASQPVTVPILINLGPIAPRCAPPPTAASYLPSVNGYAFQNPAHPTGPSYDQMALYYPDSHDRIYYPFTHIPTVIGFFGFYQGLFLPFYVGYPFLGGGGLCYGMATSDQFLYNKFPNKSAVQLYPNLGAPYPDAASPSPSDPTIEAFIDRYHSRQLAAAGALESIASWQNAARNGNRAAMNEIATAVAGGKTEWVGLGPNPALLTSNPLKFVDYFNKSHAVLAYSVDKSSEQIKVYDPSDQGNDSALIQIVDTPGNPGGGIELRDHNGGPNGAWYGGGPFGGNDWGQPGDWVLMPLPEGAFTEESLLFPLEDNRHWLLDVGRPIGWIDGGIVPTLGGIPVFRILDARTPDHTSIEMLPSEAGLAGTITAIGPGARTSEITGSHVAQTTQTDAGAAGTTHQVSISSNASRVTLSNASSVQQYTAMLGADFLPSYGRMMTVSEAVLAPGGTLEISANPTYSSLSLAGSSTSQAGLLLEQFGQGASSARVTVTIPGGDAQGTVFVADWTSLATSLIFEVVTTADGHVTVTLLQDNATQRQQLVSRLLQDMHTSINQVANDGLRNSLQAKLDNAAKQISNGNPSAAADVLDALALEVAAQAGKAIPADLAASLIASLRETIGLLRASSA